MHIWQPSADSPLHSCWVHTLIFCIGQQWSRTPAVAALQPTRKSLFLHFDVTSHHKMRHKLQCPGTVQPHPCHCLFGLSTVQPSPCPLPLVKPRVNEMLLMELYNTENLCLFVFPKTGRISLGGQSRSMKENSFFSNSTELPWCWCEIFLKHVKHIIESKAKTST